MTFSSSAWPAVFLAALLFGTLAVLGFTAERAGAQGQDKVLLCHFDVGGGEGHIIEVASPAADAHLENHEGDYVVSAGTPGDYDESAGTPGDVCPSQGTAGPDGTGSSLAQTGLDAPVVALLGIVLAGGGLLLRRKAATS